MKPVSFRSFDGLIQPDEAIKHHTQLGLFSSPLDSTLMHRHRGWYVLPILIGIGILTRRSIFDFFFILAFPDQQSLGSANVRRSVISENYFE